MQLTDREKILIRVGFGYGYQSGHNDTVESVFNLDHLEESGVFLSESIADGSIQHAYDQMDHEQNSIHNIGR